jgi:hypothetical protein
MLLVAQPGQEYHRAQRVETEQGSEPHRRRDAERCVGQHQSKDAADCAKRECCQHDQRVTEGLEQQVKQQQHDEQRDGYDERETMQFLLKAVVFAGPGIGVAGWQLYLASENIF